MVDVKFYFALSVSFFLAAFTEIAPNSFQLRFKREFSE